MRVEATILQLGRLDELARQATPIHHIDPRAKLVATLVFIGVVASFGRYEVAALAPFLAFPMALASLGRVPWGYLLTKVVWVAPFAVLVGLFNPLLDREVLVHIGPIPVSGGWVSFASVLVRFALTVSSALLLVAVTGFDRLCLALSQLGVPRAFVAQLRFLYRYVFLLTSEGARMVRARKLRSFGARGASFASLGPMLGHLLLRTLDRGERIQVAMASRGFDGQVRVLERSRFGLKDITFVLGWSALFLALRLFNLPQWIGALLSGSAP